jgi:catechol 2,3-dioxygenase-like lactoylglutathione lyase family enzyme
MALFVRDAERMIDFYGRVLGLKVSDGRKREVGASRGDSEIVFLSNEPQIYQQLQLSAASFDDDECNVVHQISFRLAGLSDLREVTRRIIEETQIDSEQWTMVMLGHFIFGIQNVICWSSTLTRHGKLITLLQKFLM